MKTVEDKRTREKLLVSQMIALYCRKKHRVKGGLCPSCRELDEYAKNEKRQMSLYGDKNLLLKLQGALL